MRKEKEEKKCKGGKETEAMGREAVAVNTREGKFIGDYKGEHKSR